MKKLILPILLTALLTACGGGGDDTPKSSTKILQKVLLPASHNPEEYKNAPEYNLYMFASDNADISSSVNAQSKFAGDAILFIGPTKSAGFSKSKEYIDTATQYGKFKYVYLYDELFWEDGKVDIGKNEDNVLEIAHYARSKNMKSALTIMPSIILGDNFKLKDINSYDAIAVDVYPSIIVSTYTNGCKYNENLYTNLLYCSQKKLRDMGYTGQVWYVYQAFGINGEDPKTLIEKFKLQKETINSAKDIGIEGLIPFGYYMSQGALESEPVLYQGYGSVIDEYVR